MTRLFPGRSSEDSDVEPAGGPSFERALVDTTAASGSEVTLKCIVTGTPPLSGTTENK